MSKLLPKRVKEFVSTDSDFDTPDKRPQKKYTKSSSILPRRTAELDLNLSDSDESSEKNDKLNCAILNDSFVFTPSKDPDLIKTPCTASQPKDENKNTLNFEKQQPDDSGFISRIGNLKVDSPDKKVVTQVEALPYRPLKPKSRTQLFTSEDTKPEPHPSSQQVVEPPKIEELIKKSFPSARKPFIDTRPPISSYMKSTSNSEEAKETPLKNSHDFQFVTPSARPFSAFKANNPVLSATAERDVNKPKIVFKTPTPGLLKGGHHVTPLQRNLSPVKETAKTSSAIDENILVINKVEYVIDKKIGSGGSSLVYLAKGKNTGKECAIKVVNLDGDAQMIEGYLNETQLLARLQRNINVIELYDYCHMPEKKTLYMIMERGESDLHRILQGYCTHIPLYTLMNYWYQMLQAVNYIHQHGVIHSDLKPANFLMVNGRLKLIDFGIASNIAVDSTSIIKFSQAGTFNYISPEALIDTSTGDSPARDQPRIRISTRSDVYSLGCILYLLLYKKTPFSHIKQLPQKIIAITSPKTVIDYPEVPNFYPPMLVEMLKKCLIYNPKQRPTVSELLTYPFDMVIPINQ